MSSLNLSTTLALAERLMTRLMEPPLSNIAEQEVGTLCLALVSFGRRLESHHASTLDKLQEEFSLLCQNPNVNLSLRLQMLEVVELRTLGWQTNPTLENYYSKRRATTSSSSPQHRGDYVEYSTFVKLNN